MRKLFLWFTPLAVGATASSVRSPAERLRYICEKVAALLPESANCRSEPVKPEDRESIIGAMVEFVEGEGSDIERFVSVLSNARRCGISSSELDSYKWDVLSALIGKPSEAKKRGASAELAEEDAGSNKKSRNDGEEEKETQEMEKEIVEIDTKDTEATMGSPNPIPFDTARLMNDMWSEIRHAPATAFNLHMYESLRDLQRWRAANKDYAAIREDFDLLMTMRVSSRMLANIFILAHSVMEKGLSAPIRQPTMPNYIVNEMKKPLLKRLEFYYSDKMYHWARNDKSDLSLMLADHIKAGRVDKVTNALNVALMIDTPRRDIANAFYKAYQALGGKY